MTLHRHTTHVRLGTQMLVSEQLPCHWLLRTRTGCLSGSLALLPLLSLGDGPSGTSEVLLVRRLDIECAAGGWPLQPGMLHLAC